MNTYIFRKYDIRGIVDSDFTPKVVTDLGRAFGTYVRREGGQKIAISGDVRPSSPLLIDYFSNGLLECGIIVIQLGTIPTPVNYYSMFYLDIDGAVQITGSHNPPEYNGFKFSYKKGAFYGKQIEILKSMIINQDFDYANGKIEKVNILYSYLNMLKNKIKIKKSLTVAMDCGNAVSCLVAPRIFKELGINIKEIYCEVDGTFPNHHPDPTDDNNLIDLISEVKSTSYDFGIAYDGDGDRVVAIDELGNIIRSDILMILFLPEIIKNKGDAIVYDVKCSKALEDMIIKNGGTPIMWKTGHSFIKDKMKELNVNFAGEMSGHIFFADNFYGFDDAVYVSLRLAQLLSYSNKKLSELIAEIPIYFSTPELRIECNSDEEKFDIASKAKKYFLSKFSCSTVDGVRIQFDDGWGLVRASNTQPVIVCRFEAQSIDRMNEIKTLVLNKLNEYGDILIDNI